MWRWQKVVGGIVVAGGLLVVALPVQAVGSESRVNEAFRGVFGKNPVAAENVYWLGRVVRGEKKSFGELQGAMFYHKALGATMGSASSGATQGKVNGAKSDNKQQMIKDVLPLFVEIYGKDPTKGEKAWWRKRISCGEISTNNNLVNSMRFHKGKGVGKGRDTICGQKVKTTSGVTGRAVSGIDQHIMGPQVRIGIYKTGVGGTVSVTADGKYQVREGASKILGTMGKDDVVKLSWSDGKYHVRGPGVSYDVAGKIRLVPLNQAIMKITSFDDPSATYPGKNYNRFRGVIEVRRSDDGKNLWAINELRTEYYLRGLAETSGTGPEEYIKALGVAARTYVLYHKLAGGRSVHGEFDIGSTSDDQIYRGYEYEIITARMSSIFAKNKGTIVNNSEGDAPVSTVYFSDSDGRTRSAKEVWNTSRFPHLQHSVADPHHASSSCKGHCVGMSAQGAFGFAKKDGWSFQKILNYYYKGIKLVKAY